MRMWEKLSVACVLVLHGSLLAWSATRHSPVIDEVGHMPAGLSHWRLQRFDLYNVNPPLVRSVAVLPMHLLDESIEFAGYKLLPSARSEFQIGTRWITAHPESFQKSFAIARWACIPFSLLGAVTCFLWARELCGSNAGMMWEQHVRHPHFQQFRGHQIGGKIFEKYFPRTRRIRFFSAERL